MSRFLPGKDPEAVPIVLLHGTGGRETDLIPYAHGIAPGSAKLGLRGTAVPEGGGYAFFQRYPDRRVNEADLAERVPALAESIRALLVQRGVHGRPVAVGYSNGAIMAAALLHCVPGLLAGAILLRSLRPFAGDPPERLDKTPVLIIDAERDQRRSPEDGFRVAEQLRRAGASVTRHVLAGDHTLTAQDTAIARDWLQTVSISSRRIS